MFQGNIINMSKCFPGFNFPSAPVQGEFDQSTQTFSVHFTNKDCDVGFKH